METQWIHSQNHSMDRIRILFVCLLSCHLQRSVPSRSICQQFLRLCQRRATGLQNRIVNDRFTSFGIFIVGHYVISGLGHFQPLEASEIGRNSSTDAKKKSNSIRNQLWNNRHYKHSQSHKCFPGEKNLWWNSNQIQLDQHSFPSPLLIHDDFCGNHWQRLCEAGI